MQGRERGRETQDLRLSVLGAQEAEVICSSSWCRVQGVGLCAWIPRKEHARLAFPLLGPYALNPKQRTGTPM